MAVIRELVEDPGFTSQLSKYGSVRRMDDILDGAHWAMATMPEVRPEIADGHRMLITRPVSDIPAFMILYKILDDDHVELFAIESLG